MTALIVCPECSAREHRVVFHLLTTPPFHELKDRPSVVVLTPAQVDALCPR